MAAYILSIFPVIRGRLYHQILELSPPYYIQPRLHLLCHDFYLDPIPENAEFWCNKLFYLHTPIVLIAEEFDTYCDHS